MCRPPAVNICGGFHSILTSLRDDEGSMFSSQRKQIVDMLALRLQGCANRICIERSCNGVHMSARTSSKSPDSVRVLDTYNLTAAKAAAYSCDALTKAILFKPSTYAPACQNG